MRRACAQTNGGCRRLRQFWREAADALHVSDASPGSSHVRRERSIQGTACQRAMEPQAAEANKRTAEGEAAEEVRLIGCARVVGV
jgi:hypothetical protein